jgi:hypothetical protein
VLQSICGAGILKAKASVLRLLLVLLSYSGLSFGLTLWVSCSILTWGPFIAAWSLLTSYDQGGSCCGKGPFVVSKWACQLGAKLCEQPVSLSGLLLHN